MNQPEKNQPIKGPQEPIAFNDSSGFATGRKTSQDEDFFQILGVQRGQSRSCSQDLQSYEDIQKLFKVRICLQQNCTFSRIINTSQQMNDHINHKSINEMELKKIRNQKYCNAKLKIQQPQKYKELMNLLKCNRITLHQLIVDSIQQLVKLQKQLYTYFDNVQQSFQNPQNLPKLHIKKEQDFFYIINQVQQSNYSKNHFQYPNIMYPLEKARKLGFRIKNLKNKYHPKFIQLCKKVKNQVQSKQLENPENIFDYFTLKMANKKIFSNYFKHDTYGVDNLQKRVWKMDLERGGIRSGLVQVISQKKIMLQSSIKINQNCGNIAFIEYRLPDLLEKAKQDKEDCKITFKFDRISGLVYVGMCRFKEALKKGYQNCFELGCFISNQKTVHPYMFNKNKLDWSFTSADILTLYREGKTIYVAKKGYRLPFLQSLFNKQNPNYIPLSESKNKGPIL